MVRILEEHTDNSSLKRLLQHLTLMKIDAICGAELDRYEESTKITINTHSSGNPLFVLQIG